MSARSFFIIIVVSGISLLNLIFGGELRFCFYGPQRIRYEDCPGGFIARVPIASTCTYYRNTEGSPNMKLAIGSDVCDHSTYKEIEPGPDQPVIPIQLVRFYDIGVNSTKGEENHPDLCNETCLPDWIDMTTRREFKLLYDRELSFWKSLDAELKPNAVVTRWIMYKTTIERLVEKGDEMALEQALQDAGEMFEIETTANIVQPSEPVEIMEESHDIRDSPLSSILKILGQAFRITYKQCQPFIDPMILKRTFRFIKELRKLSNYFLNMDPVSLKRILDILHECETRENEDFELRGHSCPHHDVTRIYNKRKGYEMNYINHNRSIYYGDKDVIITIGWNAVQLVHGYCFQFFQDDILHFSLMMKAFQDFFMDNFIRHYWMYPVLKRPLTTVSKDAYETYFESSWEELYLLHDNLDACVEAAYENSVFGNQLNYPYFYTTMMDINEWRDIAPAEVLRNTTGWKGSIGTYWKKYEKTLFTQMVENVGICFKSDEEFQQSGTALVKRLCHWDD